MSHSFSDFFLAKPSFFGFDSKQEVSSELENLTDKFRERRDLNPGLLGEKRERYLCAMTPPHSFCDRIWTSEFNLALLLTTLRFGSWHLRNEIATVLGNKTVDPIVIVKMKGNKCVTKTITLDSEMITLINIGFDSQVQSIEAMIVMIKEKKSFQIWLFVFIQAWQRLLAVCFVD